MSPTNEVVWGNPDRERQRLLKWSGVWNETFIYSLFGLLRLCIWVGIGFRFFTHWKELSQSPYGVQTTYIFCCVWIFNLVYLGILWRLFVKISRPRSEQKVSQTLLPQWIVWGQIVSDAAFYYTFYTLTMELESDFFLFLFVPFFVSLMLLDFKKNLYTSGLLMLLLFVPLLLIWKHPPNPDQQRPLWQIIGNIWAPRAFVFLMVGIPTAWLVQSYRRLNAKEAKVYDLLLKISINDTEKEILNTLIDSPIQLGYDRARIWLLDPNNRGSLKSYACRGWHSMEKEINEGQLSLPNNMADRQTVLDERKSIRFRYKADRADKAYRPVQTQFDWRYVSDEIMREQLDKQGVYEWLEIPLLAGQEHLGKLSIDNKFSRASFLDTDIILLNMLATAAAEAIKRARYVTQIKEANLGKERLIFLLSHQLRAPLTSMGLYCQFLLDGVEDPERRKKFLEVIKMEAGLFARIAENVRYYASLDAQQIEFHLQPTELSKILHGATDIYKIVAEQKGIDFQVEISPELDMLQVSAHDDYLMLALMNLIDNALNYTRKGGTVWVGVKGADGCCRISIKDTGIGIPKEKRPYIFDPFFRGVDNSRDNVPGTGIGLTIVKDIVNRHYGDIEVQSEPDQGSEFIVILPNGGENNENSLP